MFLMILFVYLIERTERGTGHRSDASRDATVCCRCDYPAVTDCILPAGGARDNPDLRRCAPDRLDFRNKLLIILFFIC